jgi:protein TonB
MFNGVVNPADSGMTRKWYSVPVSIAVHVAALTVLVVAPLVAMNGLPTARSMIVFVSTPPPRLPAVPPPPQAAPPAHAPAPVAPRPVDPDAAPVVAPTGIAAESAIPRLTATGVGGGLPPAIATVGAGQLAAAPLSPPQIVRPGGDIKEPRKTHDARPVYPPVAIAAKVEGVVIIEATIGTDGAVVNARVTRSVPLLDQAALDAVRQWRFTPTLLNGTPVDVLMTVTVHFTLR